MTTEVEEPTIFVSSRRRIADKGSSPEPEQKSVSTSPGSPQSRQLAVAHSHNATVSTTMVHMLFTLNGNISDHSMMLHW